MILNRIYEELTLYRNLLLDKEAAFEPLLKEIPLRYQQSARNLLYYLTLRGIEIRPLQSKLHAVGLASLMESESHIFYEIEQVLNLLERMVSMPTYTRKQPPYHVCDIDEGYSLIAHHTDELFGPIESTGKVKVMVTLPTDAAEDENLIRDLLRNGMDVARINCSHDSESIWLKMIESVKRICAEENQDCKIYMDLMGPKLRIHHLDCPLSKKGKPKGFYLSEQDELFFHQEADSEDAQSLQRDHGKTVIGLSIKSIFEDVQEGEKIFFDDGKFGGRITQKGKDWFRVRITRAPIEKPYLKPEKGVNLPDTNLQIPSLTELDLGVLPFVCKHADLVGYSFVRNGNDVEQLLANMQQHKEGNKLPALILKIERKEAIENLPELLLKGMKSDGLGVMIARGDLAVEIGFDRMSEIQMEIMQLCSAAHVPVIWATQVLEKLAKEGVPSRSEISDVVEAAKADCVMLNKGKNIIATVKTLNEILLRVKGHMDKKRYVMRPLSIAQHFANQNP